MLPWETVRAQIVKRPNAIPEPFGRRAGSREAHEPAAWPRDRRSWLADTSDRWDASHVRRSLFVNKSGQGARGIQAEARRPCASVLVRLRRRVASEVRMLLHTETFRGGAAPSRFRKRSEFVKKSAAAASNGMKVPGRKPATAVPASAREWNQNHIGSGAWESRSVRGFAPQMSPGRRRLGFPGRLFFLSLARLPRSPARRRRVGGRVPRRI